MIESKKKRPSYDAGLIKTLAERHSVSKSYVRMSINADRVGEKSLKIAEEYKKTLSAKKIAEKQALEKLDR